MTDPDTTLSTAPGDPSADSAAFELVCVLDRYLADLQAGLAPDRDRLLAAHPELAEPLAGCLRGIEFIHSAASAAPGKPAQLGDFRILRELGRGGMGVVYEAEQISLRRRVALKVLRFGKVADDEAMQRFQREAETVARLHHTNIVPIFAIGCEDGVHYYAMQLIEGRSLADVLHDAPEPPPPETVARWGLRAAEALEHAHRRGVIHRDVKPSNLLLDNEGEVWLTDFGLARRADEVTLTGIGALLGTPRYMSPEAAESVRRPVDHRTDVYSLGATLYELATGRPVFDAQTPQAVLAQIAHAEPVPPRRVRPRFPRDLETILLECLAKEPAQRYATAQALADDLRAVLEHRPIRARRPNVARRIVRGVRKHRRSAFVAACTALVIVPLTIGAFLGWNRLRALRAQAQMGRVQVDNAGPPLRGEVLDAHDAPIVPPFVVPTEEPVPIPAGAVRMRFSTPGQFSETFLVASDPANLNLQAKIALEDRQPWPPIALDGEYAEPIDLGGRTDLLIVGTNRLRRLDGASRAELWQQSVDLAAQREWPEIARREPRQRHPALLRPAPDLDGDGTGDLVWSSAPATNGGGQCAWVLARSGRTGGLLWKIDIPRTADASPADAVTLAGDLLAIQADDDPAPDLLATFVSKHDQSARQDDRETIWLEALSGRTGRRLWKTELVQRPRRGPLWHGGEPFAQCAALIQEHDQPAVAISVDNLLATVDPRTGTPIGSVRVLTEPAAEGHSRANEGAFTSVWPRQTPWYIGGPAPIVLVEDAQFPATSTLTAFRFRDGLRLWQQKIAGRRTRWDDRTTAMADWPLLVDLDGDGDPEIALPDDGRSAGGVLETLGVRLIDRRGRTRWSRALGPAPFPAHENGPRMSAGPDLNGDRVQELFVAYVRGSKAQDTANTLVVEALSGSDGGPLWTWTHPSDSTIAFQETPISPLQWCQAGEAGATRLLVNAVTHFGAPPQASTALLLDARTGRLDSLMTQSGEPRAADLDGDGATDLVDLSDPQRVRAWRVSPADGWQRLGDDRMIADVDGDGIADLLCPAGAMLVSGRDGGVLRALKLEQVLRSQLPVTGATDLDADGTPDVVAFARHTSVPALGAVSGRTGNLLWQSDLGWPNDLFVKTHAHRVVDLDGDSRPEILFTATTTAHPFLCQRWLIAVDGRDGRIVWKQALGPPRDTAAAGLPIFAQYGFVPGVGDLDGDGRADVAVCVDTGAAVPEVIAFRGHDGARLWTRPVASRPLPSKGNPIHFESSITAIADLDGDDQPDVASVCWYGAFGPAQVRTYTQTGAPRGAWDGPAYPFDRSHTQSDAPILVELAGRRRGIGLVVAASAAYTGRPAFVVLDASGRKVQERPIALDGKPVRSVELKNPLTRHAALDLDRDGRAEQLLVDASHLRATRDGLETVVWERALTDLGSTPWEGVEILGTQPGAVSPLLVIWTGRALLYLDGPTGHTLWRVEGPSFPSALEVRPGFLPTAPRAGAPRGVFQVIDTTNSSSVFTVCRPARRVREPR